MNKNTVIGVVAVIALLVGSVTFLRGGTPGPQGPQGEPGETFGATPTLDGVDHPYVKIGGVEYYYFNQPISATSSVFCSLPNPYAPATTTILSAGTRINGTISAASTYDIATGTGRYQGTATSTPSLVRAHALAAAAQDVHTWLPRFSTTTAVNILGGILAIPDIADPAYPYILTGTQFLNWQIATATPGTDYYEGRCVALLRKG